MARRRQNKEEDDDDSSAESEASASSDSSYDEDPSEEISSKPAMQKYPMIRILVLGQSGTGKSTLVASLVEKMAKDKKVVLLNGKASDTERVPGTWKHIGWSEAPKAKRVCMVVEDVISLDKRRKDVLLGLLSFQNHHRRVSPIICVGHQIHGHKLFSLISQFHFIYCACRTSSLKTFKSLMIELSFSKEEKTRYTKLLLSNTTDYNHLMIDVERRTVAITRIGEDSPLQILLAQKNSDAQKARLVAPSMISLLPNSSYATIIFELLISKIPKINPKELTLDLRTSTSSKDSKGTKTTVNIVDYLYNLVNGDPSFVPDPLYLKMHRFVTQVKKVSIPNCYIMCKHFLPASAQQTNSLISSPSTDS